MGFPQDKVKLLVDDPETTPTFSNEEDDVDESCSVCRVLFIVLIYAVVLGTFLSAVTYHSAKQETIMVNTGHGRYYKLKVFQRGNFHTPEQWNRVQYDKVNRRDKEPYRLGGMNFKFDNSFDPPPRFEKAKTARYIVHNTVWGSISTISLSLSGAPFGMVMSFSDGTVDNSTGVPYFYLAAADPIVHNIQSNQLASLSLSEAQSDYCKAHNWDPEEPLCSRVTLNGKLFHVGPGELEFAQNALFTRHPVMKTWPKSHDWQTLKLNVTHVWLQDFYGAADIIPVEDYFKAKL